MLFSFLFSSFLQFDKFVFLNYNGDYDESLELVANLPVAYLPSGKSATGKLDTANLARKPLCRQNKISLPGKLTLKLKRQI